MSKLTFVHAPVCMYNNYSYRNELFVWPWFCHNHRHSLVHPFDNHSGKHGTQLQTYRIICV